MRYAFLGTGAMGGALARGLVSSGTCSGEELILFDTDADRLQKLASDTGGQVAESAAGAASEADVVLLCVKPAVVRQVLAEISGSVGAETIVISIAAGVPLEDLQAQLLSTVPVLRVMPNTPALAGKGAAAIAPGTAATQEHIDVAVRLLGAVGMAVVVEEKLMDAVTGLSGSGPAYVYMVIEAMADAGVSLGIPRETALKLAAQTCYGASAMVVETGVHPAVLRDQVASPGGTTIAGCAELERSGLRAALLNAVQAAARRSRELAS